MIRFAGRLSFAATFGLVTLVFVTAVFVTAVLGEEPATTAQSSVDASEDNARASEEKISAPKSPEAKQLPEAKPPVSQDSSDDIRDFKPVEADPDPLPGIRLPVDMRTGESPFLTSSFQRQIALGILLVFAVVLLLNLMLWRKSPEPEVVETPPAVDAPTYEEVLAAAAERERIKQMTQRR